MSKSGAAAVKLFSGVLADKVDAAAVSNAIEVAKVKVGGKDSLEKRVAALVKHFAAVADLPPEKRTPPGVKVINCDNCNGDSTSDLEVCPFCGLGEEGADPGDTPKSNAESSAIEAAVVEPQQLVIPEPEDLAGIANVSTPTDAQVSAAANPPPPSPVPDQKLTQVSGRGSKKDKASKGVVSAVAEVIPPAALTGEVVPSGLGPVDTFVWEVKRLQSATNVTTYMLAKKLAEGEIAGVWKTRLDKMDKPAYRNFETFAQVELGMSANYARSLLKMYAQFDEATFRAIPTTKLRLLVEAAPEAKPKVREMIDAGKSRREIEREAMGRKPGQGEQRPPGPKAKAPRPAVAETGKITLALVEGKHKFAFYDKPAKRGEEPTKRAKTFAETPWARLPIAGNDVEVLLTLRKNAAGEMEGVVEVRRVEVIK